MSERGVESAEHRPQLTRDRVLRGAVAVADAGGLGSLTMRSLARELGVKPMTVYHYVASKDAILDGIVDLVYSEIELPRGDGDWRSDMRLRAISAREVLRQHRWAIEILQSRTNAGAPTLRHHESIIGSLRRAGFSVEMTAHAYAVIDSYVYGFALSEASLPINGPETVSEVAESMSAQVSPDEYPYLVEFATEHTMRPGYDFGEEFEYGLNLILDALGKSLPDGDAAPT